jgi:hypothetical protein
LGQSVGGTHGDFTGRNSCGVKIAGHACCKGLDAPSCPKSNLNGLRMFLSQQSPYEK